MKKVMVSLLVFASLSLFAVCGKKVTIEDSRVSDRLIETTKDDELNIVASFSDHIVSFSVGISSMKSVLNNDWEIMGEEFTKSLVDQVNYKSGYTLEDDVMTWKDDKDKDNDAKYTVSREGENITSIPEKPNKSDDNEKLVLEPYKEEKN